MHKISTRRGMKPRSWLVSVLVFLLCFEVCLGASPTNVPSLKRGAASPDESSNHPLLSLLRTPGRYMPTSSRFSYFNNRHQPQSSFWNAWMRRTPPPPAAPSPPASSVTSDLESEVPETPKTAVNGDSGSVLMLNTENRHSTDGEWDQIFQFSDEELKSPEEEAAASVETPLVPLDSVMQDEDDQKALEFWRERLGVVDRLSHSVPVQGSNQTSFFSSSGSIRASSSSSSHAVSSHFRVPDRPSMSPIPEDTAEITAADDQEEETPADREESPVNNNTNDQEPPESDENGQETEPVAPTISRLTGPPKTFNVRFTKYFTASTIHEGSVHTVEFCQQWPWRSGVKARLKGYRRPKGATPVQLNLWHLREARNRDKITVKPVFPINNTHKGYPMANIPSTLQTVHLGTLYTFDSNYFWGPNVAVHTVREDPDVTIDKLLGTPELNPNKDSRTWAQIPSIKPLKILEGKVSPLYAPLPKSDMYILRHIPYNGGSTNLWRCFNARIDLPTHMNSGEYILSVDGLVSPEQDQLISAWAPTPFHVEGTAPAGYNENPEQIGVDMNESATTSMLIVPNGEFSNTIDPYLNKYTVMKRLPLRQSRIQKSASTGNMILPKVSRVSMSPPAEIVEWRNGREEQIYLAIEIDNPPRELFHLHVEIYFGEPSVEFYQPLISARIPFDMNHSDRSILEIGKQIRCSEGVLLEVIRSQESSQMMVRLRYKWQVGATFLDVMQLFVATKIRRPQKLTNHAPQIIDEASFMLPLKFLESELSLIPQSLRAFELNWFKRVHDMRKHSEEPENPTYDPNMAFRIDLPNATRQLTADWISKQFPCPLSAWEFRVHLHEFPQTPMSARELLGRKTLWDGRARFYVLHPHDALAASLDLKTIFRRINPKPDTLYFFTLYRRMSERFRRQHGDEFISKPFYIKSCSSGKC